MYSQRVQVTSMQFFAVLKGDIKLMVLLNTIVICVIILFICKRNTVVDIEFTLNIILLNQSVVLEACLTDSSNFQFVKYTCRMANIIHKFCLENKSIFCGVSCRGNITNVNEWV